MHTTHIHTYIYRAIQPSTLSILTAVGRRTVAPDSPPSSAEMLCAAIGTNSVTQLAPRPSHSHCCSRTERVQLQLRRTDTVSQQETMPLLPPTFAMVVQGSLLHYRTQHTYSPTPGTPRSGAQAVQQTVAQYTQSIIMFTHY